MGFTLGSRGGLRLVPRAEGGHPVSDVNSVPDLTDHALDEEIHLLEQVMLAASHVTRHMTSDEVDQVLSLNGPQGRSDRAP
jgi:hypothetical protein